MGALDDWAGRFGGTALLCNFALSTSCPHPERRSIRPLSPSHCIAIGSQARVNLLHGHNFPPVTPRQEKAVAAASHRLMNDPHLSRYRRARENYRLAHL